MKSISAIDREIYELLSKVIRLRKDDICSDRSWKSYRFWIEFELHGEEKGRRKFVVAFNPKLESLFVINNIAFSRYSKLSEFDKDVSKWIGDGKGFKVMRIKVAVCGKSYRVKLKLDNEVDVHTLIVNCVCVAGVIAEKLGCSS